MARLLRLLRKILRKVWAVWGFLVTFFILPLATIYQWAGHGLSRIDGTEWWDGLIPWLVYSIWMTAMTVAMIRWWIRYEWTVFRKRRGKLDS